MGEEGFDIKPTDIGQLMARYCIAYGTMKKFCHVSVDIDLEEMVNLLTICHEFSDVKLRMNERRLLNTLNKDPNHITIRFPHTGKIKTTQLKVNCLIQATLGCLPIQEFSLQQDVMKIFRVGARVSRCLYEFLKLRGNCKSLLNAAYMAKCFKARLWENSRYVSRQIERIGSSLSTALVNAGIGRLGKLLETNPRQLELLSNDFPSIQKSGGTGEGQLDFLLHYKSSIRRSLYEEGLPEWPRNGTRPANFFFECRKIEIY